MNLRRRVPVPRMWPWYAVTAVLVVAIAVLQPQQLPVVAYKMMLLTLACAVAHTIDRTLFSHEMDGFIARDVVTAARTVARALIYLGTVLGVTLGI
jgi:hypothetical protein